ncbi:MAG: MmgE/PrpD family protein, partial [Anaerolineaceae bacterium]|nr:MmgE/PrpD family protein [Anaerolineaceae bacterium]
MSRISKILADIALKFQYKDLPERAVHQAKRHLLDTIACAIGGYKSDTTRILHEVINRFGGRNESTIIGSGSESSCLNAALVNGAMVRFLDLNDFQTHVSHPSEVIPPILSLGEALHLPGKTIITSIVAAYEVLGRLTAAIPYSVFSSGGWNTDLKAGLVIPVVAGKLLNLSKEQIENAIGIAGSRCMVLGILDAPKEEYTMAKNLRFPLTAYTGLLAAFLAEKGFTGPRTVFEGQYGFIDVVLNGNFDYQRLTEDTQDLQIMYAGLKRFCSCYSTHAHIQATLEIVEKYNVQPEDIESVKIVLNTRTFNHTTDPAKRFPDNKETADHSSYYITAIVLLERMLGPEQYRSEKYADDRVKELIKKISICNDPKLDKFYPAAKVDIVLKSGARYENRVDYPKGHYSNPLSDDEIAKKLFSLSNHQMSEKQIQELIDVTYSLEKLDDIHLY